jgi:hypothetical protein
MIGKLCINLRVFSLIECLSVPEKAPLLKLFELYVYGVFIF